MVRGVYDLQKLRIESGNRLVATFKSKLGHEPGTKEADTIDEEGQSLLDELKSRFKLLTQGVVKEPAFKAAVEGRRTHRHLRGGVPDPAILSKLEASEEAHFRHLGPALEDFAVYNEFLKGVRGCGLAMSAVIIGEFDITKATYASSLWKYAGLDVVVTSDGGNSGRSRRKEHLRRIQYVDKDGKPAERDGITFNPFLKTKLTGVLASCFLKAGNEPYAGIYRNYKHRLENEERWKEKTKAHRHNAAMRYMIKAFLADLYAAWRQLEGLPCILRIARRNSE